MKTDPRGATIIRRMITMIAELVSKLTRLMMRMKQGVLQQKSITLEKMPHVTSLKMNHTTGSKSSGKDS